MWWVFFWTRRKWVQGGVYSVMPAGIKLCEILREDTQRKCQRASKIIINDRKGTKKKRDRWRD